MHAYSSFGGIYVDYRYARAEELRELRRRRMFFKEVNDFFRIALVCSVQRKSCKITYASRDMTLRHMPPQISNETQRKRLGFLHFIRTGTALA